KRDMSGAWLDQLTSLRNAHLSGVHLQLPGYGDDGPTLEIFSYNQLVEPDLPSANQCGFGHIAFAVDDVDEALRAVVAAGGSTDAVDATLSMAARNCEPIVLQSLEVSHSDEFIKTLFVQFAMNRQLQQVNQSIRAEVQDSSDYQLNPHLSLLYKRMSIQERCLLTRSIEVPLPEVAFDSLKAVRCVSPTRNRADVEAWRVIGEKPLGSIGV